MTETVEYPLATASPRAPERFRSALFADGGDDTAGVIRTAILRRTPLHGSYHHADRTVMTELALYGPFYQVPDWLYFRRDHPERAERACPTMRTPVREHGPPPGGPAEAPRRPPVRRVRLGVHRGRSGVRRCRPRTGASAIAISRSGSRAGRSPDVPGGPRRRLPTFLSPSRLTRSSRPAWSEREQFLLFSP